MREASVANNPISRVVPAVVLGIMFAGCSRVSLPADASPEALALAAVEACGSRQSEARKVCYEAQLLDELQRSGIDAALGMLEALADADVAARASGHLFSHTIGIRGYSPRLPFTESFNQCNDIFLSGCHHGVVQAHLAAHGELSAESVDGVCAPYGADPDGRLLFFQCLHGLGHGLTMHHRYDVPQALESCDLLAGRFSQESCYGGVFMESIVNATDPHHQVQALVAEADDTVGADADQHREHGAHSHGAMAMAENVEPFEALREDDPHYPCSILDDRYLGACYMLQTSAMLWLNDWDIAATAASCAEAPEQFRMHCFLSLGRDIGGRTLQDPVKSVRECQKSPREYRPSCYSGIMQNFDVRVPTEERFALCSNVEAWAKVHCNEVLGQEISYTHREVDALLRECAGAETDELERACLRGAVVRLTYPPTAAANWFSPSTTPSAF